MRFEFATAGRILFGEGAVREVAPEARRMGSRALLVWGLPAAKAQWMTQELEAAGLACTGLAVAGEPTLELVRCGAGRAREEACDVVIGFGGGSAVDAAKAIAALAANGGDPLDYLEVIGQGRPLERPSIPFIAVPTTAGTGAEVTRNAVLASPEHKVKASLRSPYMLARLAVVDPELTLELPPAVTAATGMDALTQLIEPYVSVRANPLTDLFCVEGIRRAARSLVRAFRDGGDREARADMALASLLGGLALANAGLGAVHGFAAPIGGRFDAPHGAVCAALLAPVMEVNIGALRARAPAGEALRRYEEIARLLIGRAEARAEDGVEWVRRMCAELAIPPLSAYGIGAAELDLVAEQAARASSMKGNPIQLTAGELREILVKAGALR
jgi:alcohol dehydrogenase class IV